MPRDENKVWVAARMTLAEAEELRAYAAGERDDQGSMPIDGPAHRGYEKLVKAIAVARKRAISIPNEEYRTRAAVQRTLMETFPNGRGYNSWITKDGMRHASISFRDYGVIEGVHKTWSGAFDQISAELQAVPKKKKG